MKYKKDYMWLFTALTVGFLAMGGDGLADIANKPFWYNTWAVLGVVCAVLCVGGWLYLWKTQDKTRK